MPQKNKIANQWINDLDFWNIIETKTLFDLKKIIERDWNKQKQQQHKI